MALKRYGVPYKGSKNAIATWVIGNLPEGDTLVDLFAGGCAVTHAALEQMQTIAPKWKNVVANDLCDFGIRLFSDAIDGKFANENRWISREDFFRLKDVEPYVRLCWSFGNDSCAYMYGKDKEAWKKALHYAYFFDDYSLIREFVDIPDEIKGYKALYTYLRTNKDLDLRNESLQRLQSLQSLQKTSVDYRRFSFEKGMVVYCDIPYDTKHKTHHYYRDVPQFDHPAFFDWACEQTVPVIVSSYNIDDERFEVIAEIEKNQLAGRTNTKCIERLYRPKRGCCRCTT